VDRSSIRLRAVQERAGESNLTSTTVTTVAVSVFVPVAAPFFLLRKGHDIVVPEGTRIDTFVDGDHLVGAGSAAAVQAPAVQAPAVPRTTALTNADIIALRQVGFDNEVILATIAASPAAYNLAPTEMVALKKAGVSDRVITALVSAK